MYNNLFECVQVGGDWDDRNQIFYFKILNCTEIKSLIHTKETSKMYGSVSLCNNFIISYDDFWHWYSAKFYEDIPAGRGHYCLYNYRGLWDILD